VALDCVGATPLSKASVRPCAWNGTVCIPFTGCTAYVYDTNEKCQEVSTRCITDGVHCVEKDLCTTYKTSKSCDISATNSYCFWNTSDPLNLKCEDANECAKLPKKLTTH
jgi:Notch-like protein